MFARRFFVAVVLLWQTSLSLSLRHEPIMNKRQEAGNDTLDTYDFVIVGSGPGGGTTASYLAIAGFKVLLIDAGGDSGEMIMEQVPAFNLLTSEFMETEWDFYVQHHADLEQQEQDSKMVYELPDGTLYSGLSPPENALSLGIWYPRAGTLGGCSRHNSLIAMQSFDSDWDGIAKLTGDDTWEAVNMQGYFKKIEKNEYLPSSIIGHGFTGFLVTSLTSLFTTISDLKVVSLIAAAATAIGKTVPTSIITTVAGLAQVLTEDINAPGQLLVPGVYQVPLTMRNSARGGVRDIIIDTAYATNSDGSRKYHLDIKLNTLVTKILFDQGSQTPRATGVEFLEGQSLYRADKRSKNASPTGSGTVNVTREVIIAGGAYNTPQILKLSGIGPRDELDSFGIPVIVDLPGVGTNLQDHYEETIITQASSNFSLIDGCTFQTDPSQDPCLVKWQTGIDTTAKGVYATNGIALAIIQKSSVADTQDPDLIITGGPAYFKGYYPGWGHDGIQEHHWWSWITLKAHTGSTDGTVLLKSADPRDTPNITVNMFSQGGEMDLQAMAEGLEYSRRAAASVIPLDGTFKEVWPGTNVSSTQDLKDYIFRESWGHHACCTAPIGVDEDPMAVLDSSFRVRGTNGLRVVDASIFPKVPGFFVQVPIYMVAAKASDVIIADNQTE